MTRGPQTFDDVVVGGGAVGLFAALALASRGRTVCVLDAAPARRGNAYSVPLHPRSLDQLASFGLLSGLEETGRRIDRLTWQRDGHPMAEVRFDRLATDHAAVLLAPLDALESVLERGATAAGVAIRRGARVDRLEETADGVRLTVAGEYGAAPSLQADQVIGADGCHSSTREWAGIDYAEMAPDETYLVFEGMAPDPAPTGIEVMIHDGMASSVWPLAGGRWRGNLRVPPGAEANLDPSPEAWVELLSDWLAARSGGRYRAVQSVDWAVKAPFGMKLVTAFGRGRVHVAGDAAHSAGPTAAHSMNRGFAVVHELASLLQQEADDPLRTEGLRAMDARHRAGWHAVFGRADAVVAPAVAADWPKSWVDTIPASGAHLEALTAQVGHQRHST